MDKVAHHSRGPGIGRGELEVLRFIQGRNPVTVREVADHLARSRGLVRTTVLNVMNRLVRKGFLTRKRVEGVFQYVPRVERGRLLRNLIGRFVKETLGGSVAPFVAYLADDAQLTEEELAQLRKLVDEMEKRR